MAINLSDYMTMLPEGYANKQSMVPKNPTTASLNQTVYPGNPKNYYENTQKVIEENKLKNLAATQNQMASKYLKSSNPNMGSLGETSFNLNITDTFNKNAPNIGKSKVVPQNVITTDPGIDLKSTVQKIQDAMVGSNNNSVPTSQEYNPFYVNDGTGGSGVGGGVGGGIGTGAGTGVNQFNGSGTGDDLILNNIIGENGAFDIPKYFQLANSGQLTLENLYKLNGALNNARNAIAVGSNDPYKIEEKYGMRFSPGQKEMGEKSFASIYDPILNDINGRIRYEMDMNKIIASKASSSSNLMNGLDLSTTEGDFYGSNPDYVAANLLAKLPAERAKAFSALYSSAKENGLDTSSILIQQARMALTPTQQQEMSTVEANAYAYSNAITLAKELQAEGIIPITNNAMEKLKNLANSKNADPRITELWSLLGSANADTRLKYAGSALTPTEAAHLKNFLPDKNDSWQELIIKAEKMSELLQTAADRMPLALLGFSFRDSHGGRVEIVNKNGSSLSSSMGTGTGIGGSNSISQYEIDELRNKYNFTTEEINKYLGFNNVGSGTNTASKVTSVQDAMKRIARNESHGAANNGYGAIGPVVTSGQYKGERALGKYQVMPGNIASWSKEILGYSITPQQFYNSPQLQDKIAEGKLTQYYQKYGSWDDAASAWFTGGPVNSKNNAKKDVLGTSGLAYVKKFNS